MLMKIITDDNRELPLKEWLDETEQMLIPNQYLICENMIKKYDKELDQLKKDILKIAQENDVWVDEDMPIEIEGDCEDPNAYSIILRVQNNGYNEYKKIQDKIYDLFWQLPKELYIKLSIRDW